MGKAVVNAEAGLNIRDKPGGTKIGSLNKGAIFDLLQLDAGWWKIRADGRTGFVAARYVTTIPEIQVVKPKSISVRGSARSEHWMRFALALHPTSAAPSQVDNR